MLTFNKTLEAIMEMDYDSREMLIEIIHKRQIEERRTEIAKNAQQAKDEFYNKKRRPLTAFEAIKILSK